MKSFEAIGLCVGRDADLLADVMGIAPISIRRWKQDPLQSGSRNPLDTLEAMMATALEAGKPRSEALAPLTYLQSRFNPAEVVLSTIHETFADLQMETSHLGQEYSAAVRDGFISPDEARRMRREVLHMRQRLDEMDTVLKGV